MVGKADTRDGVPVLSRALLREQAVEVIRNMVVSGALASGDRINEVELAGRLGISRGPLREAIQRLSSEGVIELRQNRGAYVRAITPEDVRHMYEARELIEVRAAELAAEHASEADIVALRETLDGVRAALQNDAGASYPQEADVHDLVLSLSGNRYLQQVGVDLQNRVRVARAKSGSSPGRAREALAEHHEIVEAIAGRDGERAATAMANHLRNSLQHLFESAEE
ncbi:GntR family transcriptional regulator [Streptomyces sp. NPDC001982]|uniref:GntR family transcriptional regulator n=1 Tax=Streptomyces sp. NPDC001982 TaxID=3154405 RepID=UPI0033179A35